MTGVQTCALPICFAEHVTVTWCFARADLDSQAQFVAHDDVCPDLGTIASSQWSSFVSFKRIAFASAFGGSYCNYSVPDASADI